MITIKIFFTNTIEDLLIFNKESKASKRSKYAKFISTGIAPIIVVLNLIYQYINQALNFLSIVMVVFGILWIIFFPKFLDIVYKKRFLDMLGPINLESTALELSNEGLEAKSNSSEYKLPWNSVDNILVTKELILIYLNINSGLAIPFRAFSSIVERDSFIKYLYDHTQ